MVLDVVHRIQATQAPDLAVRWNCKAGKCGSCSAEVNGRPRLMCMTRMNIFDPTDTVTVTPLRAFPVLRGLPYLAFVDEDGTVTYVDAVVIKSTDQLADLVEQHLGISL